MKAGTSGPRRATKLPSKTRVSITCPGTWPLWNSTLPPASRMRFDSGGKHTAALTSPSAKAAGIAFCGIGTRITSRIDIRTEASASASSWMCRVPGSMATRRSRSAASPARPAAPTTTSAPLE